MTTRAPVDHPVDIGRPAPHGFYGLMAEFNNPTELVEATRAAVAAGYRRLDGYSPFPIHEMFDALRVRKSALPLLTLIGGLTGCFVGFFMQWFSRNVHYPMNIGGKPLNAWPMFIPITFEMTILFAGITCTLAMLILNGFPSPYHPVFNVPRFARASQDGFFLVIEASDPKFSLEETRRFLESQHAVEVFEVAP